MVRFTSASLAFLGAIGSVLAQHQSILVGFSSQAGLDAVLERVTPPGAATAGSPGSNADAPKMFRRPLKVAARAQADVDTAAFLVASDFPAKPPKGRVSDRRVNLSGSDLPLQRLIYFCRLSRPGSSRPQASRP